MCMHLYSLLFLNTLTAIEFIVFSRQDTWSQLDFSISLKFFFLDHLYVCLCPSPCRNTLAGFGPCNVMSSMLLVVLLMEH